MHGTLYYNESDNKVVDKKLSKSKSITLHFKEDTNIIEPTIYISRNIDIDNYNYIHISSIDRYYYITDYDTSQQRYIVKCKLDTLMSFKKYIKKSFCIVKRSQSNYDLYLNDELFTLENVARFKCKHFPSGFCDNNGNREKSFILAINGGGENVS
jgi:hypothetical protein